MLFTLQRCVYGPKVGKACGNLGREFDEAGFRQLFFLCHGKNRCTITINPQRHGGTFYVFDEAPYKYYDQMCVGTAKYLRVEYSCEGGYPSCWTVARNHCLFLHAR